VNQVVFGVEAVGSPQDECVALVRDEPQDVRLKRNVDYPLPTLSLGTLMEQDTRVRVELLDDETVVSSVELNIGSGLQRTFASMTGPGDELRVTSLAGRLVCVTDATLGERFHWEDGWVQDGSSLPTQSFSLSR
jgi:hypothetical protein